MKLVIEQDEVMEAVTEWLKLQGVQVDTKTLAVEYVEQGQYDDRDTVGFRLSVKFKGKEK